jgi:hypothetical protein
MNLCVNQLVETGVTLQVPNARGKLATRTFGVKLRPGVVYEPVPAELVERMQSAARQCPGGPRRRGVIGDCR